MQKGCVCKSVSEKVLQDLQGRGTLGSKMQKCISNIRREKNQPNEPSAENILAKALAKVSFLFGR